MLASIYCSNANANANGAPLSRPCCFSPSEMVSMTSELSYFFFIPAWRRVKLFHWVIDQLWSTTPAEYWTRPTSKNECVFVERRARWRQETHVGGGDPLTLKIEGVSVSCLKHLMRRGGNTNGAPSGTKSFRNIPGIPTMQQGLRGNLLVFEWSHLVWDQEAWNEVGSGLGPDPDPDPHLFFTCSSFLFPDAFRSPTQTAG